MAKFRKLALFFAAVEMFAFAAAAAAGSILSVEGGVYSRVTARIDADAVPMPHCRRAIKNLQVSTKQRQRHLIRYLALPRSQNSKQYRRHSNHKEKN